MRLQSNDLALQMGKMRLSEGEGLLKVAQQG